MHPLMYARFVTVAMGLLWAASSPSAQGDKASPPREEFEHLLSLIKPSPGEARWDEISWTTNLWEARKRAAAEGKPLFVWATHGNPLGMTCAVGTWTRDKSHWTPERVKLIRERFVAVATPLLSYPKDAEGDWWKRIARQGGWGTGRFHGVTPAGEMLCGTDSKPDCDGGNCRPEGAWARWRGLPESVRRPGALKVEDIEDLDPGFPKRPLGSIILKGYNRPLERDDADLLRRIKSYRHCREVDSEGPNWKTFEDPEPGRTFVWLTEAQWKSILSSRPRGALTYALPDEVADRLVRMTLLNTVY